MSEERKMDKNQLIEILKDYFESPAFLEKLDLHSTPLLAAERIGLERMSWNWQSLTLSSLMDLPTLDPDVHLFYHWKVQGLPPATNVRNHFCRKGGWGLQLKGCDRAQCWKKKETEVDAVLKDKSGNWMAHFEYEHTYNECCDELSSLEKILKWIKKNKAMAPIFCLIYWLPLNPEKACKDSRENLVRWYIDFLRNHIGKILLGTRFMIVMMSGPDHPKKNAVAKVKVLLDEDFDKAQQIIEKEFGPCVK
jgi:hypothetical protein